MTSLMLLIVTQTSQGYKYVEVTQLD